MQEMFPKLHFPFGIQSLETVYQKRNKEMSSSKGTFSFHGIASTVSSFWRQVPTAHFNLDCKYWTISKADSSGWNVTLKIYVYAVISCIKY